jgi:hypothetical protein
MKDYTLQLVGFTGTSEGTAPLQYKAMVRELERAYRPGAQFHFGDCVGADAEAAAVASTLGYELHCHPPDNPRKRAYIPAAVYYPPKPTLIRNRDIVRAVKLLIATPLHNMEQRRSGTWSTIRYAKQAGVHEIDVIGRDGQITIWRLQHARQ